MVVDPRNGVQLGEAEAEAVKKGRVKEEVVVVVEEGADELLVGRGHRAEFALLGDVVESVLDFGQLTVCDELCQVPVNCGGIEFEFCAAVDFAG